MGIHGTLQPRVAVIDDEPAMVEIVLDILLGAGAKATGFSSGEAFLASHEGPFDLILSDLSMPGLSGMQLFEAVRRRDPQIQFVIMTGHGTIPIAVEAMRLGASHFLTKPFHSEELLGLVADARARLALTPGASGLEERDFAVGRSVAWRRLMDRAFRITELPVTVLICGETGTGKEVLARYIASFGPRSRKPFVAINCAAVPEALIESELFGHAKGAFSGADVARRGLFEEANGGTLFLDEVDSMGPKPQSALLRVLEDRSIRRVGENRMIDIDARIIAATNTSLEDAVAQGRFRSDLYFRLAVVTMSIPPLRERREDIGLLATHFLKMFAKPGEMPKRLTPEALAVLERHPFPGNVRELRNVIEHALAFSDGPDLTATDVASETAEIRRPTSTTPAPERPPALTPERLNEALARTKGNRVEAAKLLGVSRSTLYRTLRQVDGAADPAT